MGSYGTFDRLAERCRELGYHGPCPEALEIIGENIAAGGEERAVRAEYREFMWGMRELLAPK